MCEREREGKAATYGIPTFFFTNKTTTSRMSNKTYGMRTVGVEHTLPVDLPDGSRKYITFRKRERSERFADYSTRDGVIQRAVEGSVMFLNGAIVIVDEEEESGVGQVYVDVTTLRQARAIMREQWGVPWSDVRNTEALREAGEKIGVYFPNLG